MITLDSLVAAFEKLGRPALERDDTSFIVAVAGDTPDEVRPLEVKIQQAEKVAKGSAVLIRFIAGLPWTVPAEEIYTTRVAAHECTEYLVLGHFEVDDDGILMLVHTAMYANNAAPTNEVLDQIYNILNYEQLHFGDYFESLLDGTVPLEEFAELVYQSEKLGID